MESFNKVLTPLDLKTQGVLEEPSDQLAVSVHFHSIPARIRDHYSGDTLSDGVVVGRHVDVEEPSAINEGIVLVDPIVRASVADKMLGTGRNIVSASIGRCVMCKSSDQQEKYVLQVLNARKLFSYSLSGNIRALVIFRDISL